MSCQVFHDLEVIDFLCNDGERALVVIEGFFDESGTHKGAPLVVVAGFVGDRKVWKSFTKEWRKCLKDAGIRYFHAKDPKCEPLKAPLAKAILRRNLFGIVCAVTPDDFRNNAGDAIKSVLGNAYSTSAFVCAEETKRFSHKRYGLDSLAIVYEAGQPNTDLINETYEAIITENPDYGISSVSIMTKEQSVPVQTADFLSHVVGTHENRWYDLFWHSGKVVFMENNPETLERSSKEINRVIGKLRKMRKGARRQAASRPDVEEG
jgi:hypothetical protein